ncbi:MAG: hypothetical protein JWP82_338 [Humibacillus sp.]|nr:hypothetical protein [Humibacillus sp.]
MTTTTRPIRTAAPVPTTTRAPLLREVYGRLLRGLRTRQGRTLSDVSAAAGVSLAYLSEVERGLKEPSSEMLEAICVALGSSIASLVAGAHRALSADVERVGDGLGDSVVLDLTTALRPGSDDTRALAERAFDPRERAVLAA